MSLLAGLIGDLPSEPSRAIIIFADRARAQILDKNRTEEKAEDYDMIAAFALKFCNRYKVPITFPGRANNMRSYDHMREIITTIVNHRSVILAQGIDSEIDKLIIQYDSGIGESFGLARLNPEEKKKIHEHIQKIREIIESSDLSDRKKNALFDRLDQLSRETDAHGTPTDRFFSFVSDLGFVLGEFGKGAKPLFHEVRGLIQTVSRARARQEGISLPPGDEPLKLASPDGETDN